VNYLRYVDYAEPSRFLYRNSALLPYVIAFRVWKELPKDSAVRFTASVKSEDLLKSNLGLNTRNEMTTNIAEESLPVIEDKRYHENDVHVAFPRKGKQRSDPNLSWTAKFRECFPYSTHESPSRE